MADKQIEAIDFEIRVAKVHGKKYGFQLRQEGLLLCAGELENIYSAESFKALELAIEQQQLKVKYMPGLLREIQQHCLDDWEKIKTPQEEVEEGAPDLATSAKKLIDAAEPGIRETANEVLLAPDVLDLLVDMTRQFVGITGETSVLKVLMLAAVSRLMEDPIHVLIQSASSAGKSFTQHGIAEMVPPEAKVMLTMSSPKSLFYQGRYCVHHKFVCLGERTASRDINPEESDGLSVFRQLMSEKDVTHQTVINGKPKSFRVTGPLSLTETTTNARIKDEDLNRMLVVHCDEDWPQTLRILDQASKARQDPGSVRQDIHQQVAHTIHRILTVHRRRVRVPFAAELAKRFGAMHDSGPCDARRAWNQLLSVTEAVALLRVLQREIDDQDCIIAMPDDYSVAKELLEPMFRDLLDLRTLAESDMVKWRALREKFGADKFQRVDVDRLFASSESGTRLLLKRLEAKGWIRRVGLLKERVAASYVVVEEGQLPTTINILPDAPVA